MLLPYKHRRSSVLCLIVFIFFGYSTTLASDGWKKIVTNKQNDVWYVDQTIGFSTRGAVTSSRALLKFVPGRKGVNRESVSGDLLRAGVDAGKFSYLVESVSVDCRKGVLSVLKKDYFDADDSIIHVSTFAAPGHYPANSDSTYGIISMDLCQTRPDPLTAIKNTLKTKKPFLYFYP